MASGSLNSCALSNQNGMKVEILSLGGIISKIEIPDKAAPNGYVDIVLGFDTVDDWESKNSPYFNAIIGRVCNRIGGGTFTLDGNTYTLVKNNGENHLHGGAKGFDKFHWKLILDGQVAQLSHENPDMHDGYPGTVRASVKYQLTDENEIVMEYMATTDKPTPINLTNHCYFNLGGHDSGPVTNHRVQILTDKLLEKDSGGIPTGRVLSVGGTLFDLQAPVELGSVLDKVSPTDMGFDHNYCLPPPPPSASGDGRLRLAARATHPGSGRALEVLTDQPGLQFYTANYLDGLAGKAGAVYRKHGALCFEAQNYPDAVNKPDFPKCVYKPGEVYTQKTIYKFIF